MNVPVLTLSQWNSHNISNCKKCSLAGNENLMLSMELNAPHLLQMRVIHFDSFIPIPIMAAELSATMHPILLFMHVGLLLSSQPKSANLSGIQLQWTLECLIKPGDTLKESKFFEVGSRGEMCFLPVSTLHGNRK